MKHFIRFLGVSLLLLAQSAVAQQFSFTILDYPNAGGVNALGINDSGTVVGSYGSGNNGNLLHGFIYTNGNYQTLDHNSDNTELLAINNSGQILVHDIDAGQYFIYSGGQFSLIGLAVDVPLGSLTCDPTMPALGGLLFINGLNNIGQVAGGASFGCGGSFPFFGSQGGVFGTPSVSPPGSITPPTSNGTYTQLNCTGQVTRATALNDNGHVTGFCGSSAFLYSGGTPVLLMFPGQSAGAAWGINNAGQVVGQYQMAATSTTLYGVLFGTSSSPVQVLPTGGISSVARAINNSGQIAGWFVDANGTYHGFVTAPTSSSGNPIQITTGSLPTAALGLAYDSGQLTATGGSGSYTWTLSSGTLPTGFTLLPTGKIIAPSTSGAMAGSYSLLIKASDINGLQFAEKSFTLVVLPMITIVDPVPQLLNGPQITANRALLASQGRIVAGIAADGIAQIVFRIPTPHAGDQITARVFSDQCPTPLTCSPSSSSDDDGGVFNVGNSVTSAESLPNAVVDTSDSSTGDAFIAYRSPIDFARPSVQTDANLASRMVYLQFSYSSSGVSYAAQTIPLAIVRPPLIFVHGFNTDSSAWDTFAPLINSTQQFSVYKVNYGMPLYSLTGFDLSNQPIFKPLSSIDVQNTNPPINLTDVKKAALRSHFGFTYNSGLVADSIESDIAGFGSGSNAQNIPVAVIGADIVGHSMGGLVVRNWASLHRYLSDSNYQHGSIHKLITLGTPHFGTPQAALSVLSQTGCSRALAAIGGGSLFFISASLSGSLTSLPGAAGELRGDGIGTNMSNALETMEALAPPIPLATIAGDVTSIEVWVDSSPVSTATLEVCAILPGLSSLTGAVIDPLALRYSTAAFGTIFDPQIFLNPLLPVANSKHTDSDGSVPLTSALMNSSITSLSLCPANLCFPGYTHSSGIVQFFNVPIFFTGNYLQDGSQVVSSRVQTLLNTSIKMAVFGGSN